MIIGVSRGISKALGYWIFRSCYDKRRVSPTVLFPSPMVPKVQIDSVASVLPPTIITSLELEERVRRESPGIDFPSGTIERLTGVRSRRVLAEGLNVSDLAIEAAKLALTRASCTIEDIDLLIFAAASSDVTEPATANIIAAALGAHCPVFDLKNACNSFVNAMETAEAMIISGKYRRVLIVNGEASSRVIRTSIKDAAGLRRAFAGFTLGDAGAAMILSASDGKRGILTSKFLSAGEHWHLSSVLGGGSRYPRDLDKFYFEGETSGLKDVFLQFAPPVLEEVLKTTGWSIEDPDVIVTHQVSMKSFDLIANKFGFDRKKFVIVLPTLGNMVSASIPVALDIAQQEGRLKPGTKVLVIGLAAGASIAPMTVIW